MEYHKKLQKGLFLLDGPSDAITHTTIASEACCTDKLFFEVVISRRAITKDSCLDKDLRSLGWVRMSAIRYRLYI